MKQPFVIATAAVIGLVAGALSPIVFAASLVFFINADWPPLSRMAPLLAVSYTHLTLPTIYSV